MQRFTPGNLGFNKVSVASNRFDSPRSTLIHPRFPRKQGTTAIASHLSAPTRERGS